MAMISVAFSPDGRRVVSGSRGKTLRVWDSGTGQPIGASLTGHTGAVNSVRSPPPVHSRPCRQHRLNLSSCPSLPAPLAYLPDLVEQIAQPTPLTDQQQRQIIIQPQPARRPRSLQPAVWPVCHWHWRGLTGRRIHNRYSLPTHRSVWSDFTSLAANSATTAATSHRTRARSRDPRGATVFPKWHRRHFQQARELLPSSAETDQLRLQCDGQPICR